MPRACPRRRASSTITAQCVPRPWEMRQLYIVEARAKPLAWHQRFGTDGPSIPKRILYIDSEGWFITASDQYGKDGALWKTLALFTAYRDRSGLDAGAAIYLPANLSHGHGR